MSVGRLRSLWKKTQTLPEIRSSKKARSSCYGAIAWSLFSRDESLKALGLIGQCVMRMRTRNMVLSRPSSRNDGVTRVRQAPPEFELWTTTT
jgi:hypothetical protein